MKPFIWFLAMAGATAVNVHFGNYGLATYFHFLTLWWLLRDAKDDR